jgi:hypothetical protein
MQQGEKGAQGAGARGTAAPVGTGSATGPRAGSAAGASDRRRGGAEKLELAIQLIEKTSTPDDEIYACLPGFYSAKCIVLGAMHLHHQGLDAAKKGLEHARELAKRDPARFEPHISTLLVRAAEFYSALGLKEESRQALREAAQIKDR